MATERAERPEGALPLRAAVAEAAERVALALRGEGDPYALSALLREGEQVASAAIRVLGPDALAPYAAGSGVLPPGGEDERLLLTTLNAYRPGDGASEVSVWSYLGLLRASRALLPGGQYEWPVVPRAGATWITAEPWPVFAHHASQLAAFAQPELAKELAGQLAPRTEDLARGFVRAVRRRDWLQAAGLGRWLSWLPGTPPTLGLESGLVFVRHMGGDDPRVALHLAAARRFAGAAG
ncbi:hypothetical protein HUT18_13155 [Streptomyces sp. NA04227]|uniref:hypothetical protein n=1 Tax=Streptomyces sp. NA04227 TaxID=2742136 RepID=UPI0015912998|nr:hypothetical protein [Streptomyces sp. NA04227]QKW07205.1 hypothetical protein HUT18_13155 [Streptomyces sp. NA04227]